VASVAPTTAPDNAESASLDITITTEGSSSITPKNVKAPAQKTAPEKKGDDSDYGGEEASDDDNCRGGQTTCCQLLFYVPLVVSFWCLLVSCLQKPKGTRKQQKTSLSMQLQPFVCGFCTMSRFI
jgi:hypothetical protein